LAPLIDSPDALKHTVEIDQPGNTLTVHRRQVRRSQVVRWNLICETIAPLYRQSQYAEPSLAELGNGIHEWYRLLRSSSIDRENPKRPDGSVMSHGRRRTHSPTPELASLFDP
jgi:hypothetical protein